MGTLLEIRWCTVCRADQPFEVPPCADGHGADCPDLACTGCGAAFVVGRVDAEPVALPLHAAAA